MDELVTFAPEVQNKRGMLARVVETVKSPRDEIELL